VTKPVRIAGVVLIVAIAAAIPALASGHSTPSPAKNAIFCPLLSGRGGLVIRHLKPVKHHRRHPGRHHNAGPSAPVGTTACYPIPCPTPYRIEPQGPTGATGNYIACRPLPCLFGATGTTGAPGVPRPIPFCRPIHCVYVAPVHGTGLKHPTEWVLPCRPIPLPPCEGPTGASCPPPPCPAAGTTMPGKSEPDILCGPIACPLRATTSRASGANTAIISCPTCPPPVSSGSAQTATAALHACPMVSVQRPAASALKTSRAT
jgi:hypothetical protein